jgi:hypothetical protein
LLGAREELGGLDDEELDPLSAVAVSPSVI